jgi:hypothetical protein
VRREREKEREREKKRERERERERELGTSSSPNDLLLSADKKRPAKKIEATEYEIVSSSFV